MAFRFKENKLYKEAQEFSLFIEKLTEKLKKKFSYYFLEQFQRESLAVLMGIAEGLEKSNKSDKCNSFTLSLDSVSRCVVLLQLFYEKGLLKDKEYFDLYEVLEKLNEMISGELELLDKGQ